MRGLKTDRTASVVIRGHAFIQNLRRGHYEVGSEACCGRKMQASWNNKRAYYRCKFPSEYAVAADNHPKTVYVREDAVLPGLDNWIEKLLDEDHIEQTCEALATASGTEPGDLPERERAIREKLKDCKAKLENYRELLESQPDVAVVGTWIAEVESERQSLERQLSNKPVNRTMSTKEVREIVAQLRDISTALEKATPVDRRAVYDELGVTLTYHPESRAIEAGAGAPRVLGVGVGGGT